MLWDVISTGKHLCECWSSTLLQAEYKTRGRAPGHEQTENHAFFSGQESGRCFHGIAENLNTWLPSHTWFSCHFPMDVFLQLLLTSSFQFLAMACFHHFLKPRISRPVFQTCFQSFLTHVPLLPGFCLLNESMIEPLTWCCVSGLRGERRII